MSTTTETKECSLCGFAKEKADYSAYSWKKPPHQRKCSTCTKKPTHRKCNLCHQPKEASKYAPYMLRDPPGSVTCSDCLQTENDKANAAKAVAEQDGYLCPIGSYLKVLEPRYAKEAGADAVPGDLVALRPAKPSIDDVVGAYDVVFYVSPLDPKRGVIKYFSRRAKGVLTFARAGGDAAAATNDGEEKKQDGEEEEEEKEGSLLTGLLQMDPSTESYVVPRSVGPHLGINAIGQIHFHSSSADDVAFYHNHGLGERMFEEGQVHSSVSMEKEDVPMMVKDNSLPLKIRYQYPEALGGYQPKVSALIQTVKQRVALPACKDDRYEWDVFQDLPAPITVEEGEALMEKAADGEKAPVFFLEPGDLWLRFTDYSDCGTEAGHPALIVARKKNGDGGAAEDQTKKRKRDD